MPSSSFPRPDQTATTRQPARPQRRAVRDAAAAASRVVVLALIAASLYVAEQRSTRLDDGDVPAPQLADVKALAPGTVRLDGPFDDNRWQAIDATGETAGVALLTSPEGDQSLGFSGPTRMLIVLDRAGRIQGVSILESRDTRDHVEQVQRSQFLKAFEGLDAETAAHAMPDAVSGATLTSFALIDAIHARLGNEKLSARFSRDPPMPVVKRLFPDAASVAPADVAGLWAVRDQQGKQLGSLVRSSPTSDRLIGYQGPTDAILSIDADAIVGDLQILDSFDNEPYVGYVRQDRSFQTIWRGAKWEEFTRDDFAGAEVEGVSGATMTSQTMAQGLRDAARRLVAERSRQADQAARQRQQATRAALTLLFVLGALGLTVRPVHGQGWLRRVWLVSVIAGLGFLNGDLLSLAQGVGWAQHGVAILTAPSLVVLTVSALMLSALGGRNTYCQHLCAHGAAQQLLPRRWRWRHPPRWLFKLLRVIRPALLIIAAAAALGLLTVELVDIEPFDAYVWRAAGWPTLTIAVLSLAASLFMPMGYCRYGCPTGAILGYVRRAPRGAHFTLGDALALGVLLIAGWRAWG